MSDMLIDNVRLVKPGEGVSCGAVRIAGGRIIEAGPGVRRGPADETVDGGGRLLTPGLIDVHTHGVGRWLYELGSEHIRAASLALGAYGTTCVFPTIVPVPGPELLKQLDTAAGALASVAGACMPGLHLEGPFMALTGAACKTVPGDLGLVDDLIAACRGRLSIMSLSPETPGVIPVIERLVEKGVVPFVTHTGATHEQAQAAIDAGARHATHFYDVFPLPPETDPGVRPVGVVEAFLADPRATVDFICDGCHVNPLAIRVAVRAKGPEGVLLITDSNVGAGLPPGVYETPWGFSVRTKPGDGARVAGNHPNAGTLAGSALTMDVGMANLLKWLDGPPAAVWAMGTLNPARLLGLRSKGRIDAGADADLVLWDDNLKAAVTWVGGKLSLRQHLELTGGLRTGRSGVGFTFGRRP